MTFEAPETCRTFGDYILLAEEVKSGRRRGETREWVGWAIPSAVPGRAPIFWRWDERRGAPARVAAVGWATYRRRQVSWSPPGQDPLSWSIGREAAETRVIRALKTARIQAEVAPGAVRAGMAAMIAEVIETGADYDEMLPRFQPTPADVSDMLVALDWWCRLATTGRRPKSRRRRWSLVYEQELLAWRASAPGGEWLSTAEMARRLGRSETVIAGHYAGAVNELWRNANVRAEPGERPEPPPINDPSFRVAIGQTRSVAGEQARRGAVD